MHRTKAEQETIIRFDRANSMATVFTFEPSCIRKLGQLEEAHPDIIKLIRKDDNGSVTYSVPKKLIGIRKPSSRTMTETERQRIRNLRNLSSK